MSNPTTATRKGGRSGTFGIPDANFKSTAGARKAYLAVWQNEWPHDDDYLRDLAREVTKESTPGCSRCQALLEHMRENHEIPAEKLPGQQPPLN